MISGILGGLGLFLLGMTLMTEGLKAAAGGVLRDVLSHFTGGPVRAFVFGVGLTILVQASSATVVMTIGFVSAGLLAFSQSIGVTFGAAVGTTSTSWLIAFLGLRFSIGVMALPIIGLGTLLRVFGRGRVAALGLAVAGFGLMFLGVGTLQDGMEALAQIVRIEAIPGSTLVGRLILVGIGTAMTVVMQSSTAAVATTLTAIHAGTIDLTHAVVLVIGHNVGTTVTAAIASIGGSVSARRTALSFILLNLFSGLLAFLMLPLWLGVFNGLAARTGIGAAPLIAFFHTGINLAGVAVLLPLIDRYGAFIVRLVPDRAPAPTRNLDATLLAVPSVAIEAARRTIGEIGATLVDATRAVLDVENPRRYLAATLDGAGRAAAETRDFLGRIHSSPEDEREYERHLGVLHAADHLDRLLEALEDPPQVATIEVDGTLRETAAAADRGLLPAFLWLDSGGSAEAPVLEPLSREIAERRRQHRPTILARAASGMIDPDRGLRILDGMRWVDRAVYHVWRATYHLSPIGQGEDDSHEVFEDAPTVREESPAVAERELDDD